MSVSISVMPPRSVAIAPLSAAIATTGGAYRPASAPPPQLALEPLARDRDGCARRSRAARQRAPPSSSASRSARSAVKSLSPPASSSSAPRARADDGEEHRLEARHADAVARDAERGLVGVERFERRRVRFVRFVRQQKTALAARAQPADRRRAEGALDVLGEADAAVVVLLVVLVLASSTVSTKPPPCARCSARREPHAATRPRSARRAGRRARRPPCGASRSARPRRPRRRAHELPEVAARDRVEAGGRFVEHDEARAAAERAARRDAPALAARELAQPPRRGGRGTCCAAARRARRPRPAAHALEAREEQQRLAHRELVVARVVLRAPAERAADRRHRRRDVAPEDRARAGRAGSTPTRIAMSVDLPAPLGPSSTAHSSAKSVRSTPSSAPGLRRRRAVKPPARAPS